MLLTDKEYERDDVCEEFADDAGRMQQLPGSCATMHWSLVTVPPCCTHCEDFKQICGALHCVETDDEEAGLQQTESKPKT